MKAHGVYWHEMLSQGKVMVFGLAGDPAGAYGVGVLELDDNADVHAITNADPAIKANVGLRCEVHIMPMGAVNR